MSSPVAKRLKLNTDMDQNFFKTIYDDKLRKLVVRCNLCNKTCDTEDQANNHKKSKTHLKKLNNINAEVLHKNIETLNISLTDCTDSKNSINVLPEVKNGNFTCEICNKFCNTKEQLENHNQGKAHKKKSLKYEFKDFKSPELSNLAPSVEINTELQVNKSKDILTESQYMEISEVEIKESNCVSPVIMNLLKPIREANWITCQLCNLSTNTEEQYKSHCNGSKHKKKLKSFNVPDEISQSGDITDDEFVSCSTCNIKIHKNNKESHDKGKLHKERLVKSTTVENTDVMVQKIDLLPELKNLKVLKFNPRKYQKEIYEKAIKDDCVIFLPTGTGKTFIGAMLILKMLEDNPHHRIAFLVDKVLLVMQQLDFLKDQFVDMSLTRFKSKNETETRKLKFIGLANDFIDTDYNCSIRDHDIIVATADLFKNTLNKQQMYWTDFCLVILDEAHHCVKEHPYNKLLWEYHLYPARILSNKSDASIIDIKSPPDVIESELEKWKIQRCKIIGLTASPAGDLDLETTYKLLETLLKSLGGVGIVTVTENIEELNEYTSLTNIESRIVYYESEEEELRDVMSESFIFLLRKFERVVNGIGNGIFVNANSKLSIEDVSNLKNQLHGFLVGVQDLQKSILNHILSLVDIIEAIDNIGYTIAKAKFNEILENDNEKVWFDNNIWTFSETSKKFRTNESSSSSSIINEIIKECKSFDGNNRTILILVKERKVAHEYSNILKKENLEFDIYLLLGHGSKGTKNKDKGMTVMKQKQALDFIREKKSQIIIATSVADEGIDLPQCDLVIIINPPNSVQALVQIRGRARKKTSRLLMLCRDQQSIDSLEQLKIKENNIQQSIAKMKDINQ